MSPERACPHCGTVLTSPALTCPACGERLHVLRPRSTAPQAPVASKSTMGGNAAKAGGIAVLLWKLKTVILLVLTKAKFLVMGFSQLSTVFSMILMAWAYSGSNGWAFSLGIVLSIYVHEMGHVQALSRYGVQASAPVFIPFVGAIIRLKQNFGSPAQDARVGLAGPLWGWGAAVFCEAMGYAFNWPLGYALGRLGAMINLFNLFPVWQLDGSRALGALNKGQRFILVAVIAVAWTLTGNGMLLLIGLAALIRAFSHRAPREPDHGVLALFAFLVLILSYMAARPLV